MINIFTVQHYHRGIGEKFSIGYQLLISTWEFVWSSLMGLPFQTQD